MLQKKTVPFIQLSAQKIIEVASERLSAQFFLHFSDID